MGVLHHREAGEPGAPAVLLLHGYPESSYMWRDVLDPLAAAGFHAVAPDLAGFGDSPPGDPGTWSRHVTLLEEFARTVGIERAAIVVHDWGGLIGLRWACDRGDLATALVISNTGFFPDGRWHGFAEALRTPGQGEELVDGMTGEAFAQLLGSLSEHIGAETAAEYYKCFGDPERRRAQLELYRSGEFSELGAYEGCLAALGVPTLLLWGADDPFAPVAGAYRFRREIPHAELVVLEGSGHFVVEDVPEAYAAAVTDFLHRSL
jgi:haloalkane dehalogenase